MKEFKESGLVFKFDNRWNVYQLDREADYRNKICKQIPETRSIDFIGFDEKSSTLLLMEAKSFRGYGDRRNVRRLTGEDDDLTIEVVQKVRDSLATIIGGTRNSTHLSGIWVKYVRHIIRNGDLKIVAWVELDVSTERRLQRAKINMGTRREVLRKRLKWLTSDVQILNTRSYGNDVEGLVVNME